MLLNITGGPDMTLSEVHEASKIIQEAAQGEDGADLTLGAVIDEKLEGQVRVTVLATGFEGTPAARRPPRQVTEGPARETPEEAETGEQKPFEEELPTYDEDDIDIPAFLRRR